MRRLEDISIILNQRREQNAPANRKIRFLQRICSRCFMEILLESPVIWGRQESVFLALPVRPRLLFMSNMAFPH